MKKALVRFLIAGLAPAASASPVLFLDSNVYPASAGMGDLAWRSAVEPFAGWDFDDGPAEPHPVNITTCSILAYGTPDDSSGESGNGNGDFIEDFPGASMVGNVKENLRLMDTTGAPIQPLFEFEDFRTGPLVTAIHAPGAVLLGALGAGLVSWLRLRRVL